MLIAGAAADGVAGVVFALTSVVALLILAATIGVISPTGNEVGPFLAVEQAALSETTPDARRTATFAWYNLAGYVATAFGALAAGIATQVLIDAGWADVDAYRAIVVGYAALGLLIGLTVSFVGAEVEPPRPAAAADSGVRRRLGLGRSKGIVARLSAPVRARRLRRRLRPAEPDGLLVPPPVRRPAGGARGDLLRREPARRGVVASARPASPPGSA